MDLALLMFPALFLLLFIGVPVAYSLFGVSLVFGWSLVWYTYPI